MLSSSKFSLARSLASLRLGGSLIPLSTAWLEHQISGPQTEGHVRADLVAGVLHSRDGVRDVARALRERAGREGGGDLAVGEPDAILGHGVERRNDRAVGDVHERICD